MTDNELPDNIKPLFVAAGWHPGRRVRVPLNAFGGEPIFPAAELLLAEFANLHVGTTGKGRDLARSDVHFDPVNIPEDAERVAPFQSQINAQLFPLGTAHNGHETLFVDERGRIYSVNAPVGEFWLMDLSFVSAMTSLLLGLRRGYEHIRGLREICAQD